MVVRKIAQKIAHRLSLFWDKLVLAPQAFWQLLKRPKYLICFLLCLFAFCYFLSFFRDGSAKLALLFSGLPFSQKVKMLGDVFLSIPENFTNFYGFIIMLLALLQAISISLLIYAWKNREHNSALNNLSTGGIGAILGFLALGCPSCGVTFVTPILTAIAGAGAAVLTESVSNIFMLLALLLTVYTIAQLGYIDYIIMSAKKYEEKHAKV